MRNCTIGTLTAPTVITLALAAWLVKRTMFTWIHSHVQRFMSYLIVHHSMINNRVTRGEPWVALWYNALLVT